MGSGGLAWSYGGAETSTLTTTNTTWSDLTDTFTDKFKDKWSESTGSVSAGTTGAATANGVSGLGIGGTSGSGSVSLSGSASGSFSASGSESASGTGTENGSGTLTDDDSNTAVTTVAITSDLSADGSTWTPVSGTESGSDTGSNDDGYKDLLTASVTDAGSWKEKMSGSDSDSASGAAGTESGSGTDKESASGTFGGKDGDTLGGHGSLDNTWSKSFSATGTPASGGLAWGSYLGAATFGESEKDHGWDNSASTLSSASASTSTTADTERLALAAGTGGGAWAVSGSVVVGDSNSGHDAATETGTQKISDNDKATETVTATLSADGSTWVPASGSASGKAYDSDVSTDTDKQSFGDTAKDNWNAADTATHGDPDDDGLETETTTGSSLTGSKSTVNWRDVWASVGSANPSVSGSMTWTYTGSGNFTGAMSGSDKFNDTNTYKEGGSTSATYATDTRSSWNLWTGSAGASVTQSGSMSVSGNATAGYTLGSSGAWVQSSGTATGSGTGFATAAYSTSAMQTDDNLTFGSGWSSYNDTSNSQTGSGTQFWNQNYNYDATYVSGSGSTSGSWVTTAGSATTSSSGTGNSGYSNGMSSGSSYSSVYSGSDSYTSLNSKQSASGSASGSTNWNYNLQTVSVLNDSGTTTTTTTADSGAATWDASYSASSSGSSVLKTWGSNSSDTVDSWLSSSASESNGGSSSWNEGYTTVTPPSGSAYTTGSGSGTATAWGSDSYKSSASGWTKDQTWGAEEYGGSYQNTSIGTGSQTTAGSDQYTYSGGWNAAVSSSGSVVVTPYGTDTAWGSASGKGVTGWIDTYTAYTPGLGGGPPSSFTTTSSGGGHPTDWSSSYSDTKGSPQFRGGPFVYEATPVPSAGPSTAAIIPGDGLDVVLPGPDNGTANPQDTLQVTPVLFDAQTTMPPMTGETKIPPQKTLPVQPPPPNKVNPNMPPPQAFGPLLTLGAPFNVFTPAVTLPFVNQIDPITTARDYASRNTAEYEKGFPYSRNLHTEIVRLESLRQDIAKLVKQYDDAQAIIDKDRKEIASLSSNPAQNQVRITQLQDDIKRQQAEQNTARIFLQTKLDLFGITMRGIYNQYKRR